MVTVLLGAAYGFGAGATFMVLLRPYELCQTAKAKRLVLCFAAVSALLWPFTAGGFIALSWFFRRCG